MNRYFKCEVCNNSCTLTVKDDNFIPKICSETGDGCDPIWKEIKNYELIKKEPDYQAMAERKQFGFFIDEKQRFCYGHLKRARSQSNRFLNAENNLYWRTFTPMTEPKEIEV